MADYDETTKNTSNGDTSNGANEPDPTATPSRRTTPDVVTLVAGVLALVTSAYVLVGGAGDLRIQWLLAAAAVVVGAVMLIASLRARRER